MTLITFSVITLVLSSMPSFVGGIQRGFGIKRDGNFGVSEGKSLS